MKILFVVAILSLSANIALTLMVINVTRNPIKDVSSKQIETQEEFPYLSKRIFVEDQNDILINFIPLRTKLVITKSPDK